MGFRLMATVKVYPTENPEKVKSAVVNLFSYSRLNVVQEGNVQTVIFEADDMGSLSKLRGILKQDRVRDAVRKALREKIEDRRIKFALNKQVAFAGHVSLCEPWGESPLGPIEVEIESDDPGMLIDWLTSRSQ